MSRRIVLVGNAPLPCAVCDRVDTADHVVRFNKAPGFGTRRGRRTDELYLINHGGQMAEWLATGELEGLEALHAARTVVLPVPMLPGHLTPHVAKELRHSTGTEVAQDRINHGEQARERLQRAGHVVVSVDAPEYLAVQQALASQMPSQMPDAGEHYPSTGFIAIYRTLAQALPGDRIELVGFTFEGWRGHSWEAERRWVDALEAQGLLSVNRMPAVA